MLEDGLIQLPKSALEALSLPNGGGYVIDAIPGGIAIYSNDEWCRKYGWD